MEFDPSEDPSSDHIPPLLTILPFLSSADDTTDSDTPDTPPSPTHGQPIPYGRPYRYHLNVPGTHDDCEEEGWTVTTHRLAVRHSVDYSSSDHFSSDDSSSDSSSSSSSETSSDSPADALSDSASKIACCICTIIFTYPWALSYGRVDLLPSPKRIRSPETAKDLEDCSEDSFKPYVPREVGLGVDFEDESSEPSRSRGADLVMDVDVVRSDGIEIDPEIQAEIDECFAYADALRDRGIDARVVVEAADRKESETSTRGPVEVRVERVTHPVMPEDTPEPAQDGAVEVTYETLGDLIQRFHDHTEAIPVHRVQVIKEAQREQGRRIVGAESAVTILTERVAELERDNKRLRGTDALNTRIWSVKVQAHIPRRSDRRVAEALRVRDAVRNLRPLMGDEVEQEEVGGNGNGGNRDGGNGNGGNGDGGNGNGGNDPLWETRMNKKKGFMPARECTYQDFLKCQPLNFNGIEGFIGLTCWFEKMGIWNSHKRTIGNEAAYAMSWAELMKLMTEVYCPRNEIQKMESELWNLTMKVNDLTVYTQRFQELILLRTRMVPNEKDRVERFIRGLPANIQGNVIAVNPARFQDAVLLTN
ncbi:putative reverse transcriptase domain-containing protein [Tanacetum coccineum]